MLVSAVNILQWYLRCTKSCGFSSFLVVLRALQPDVPNVEFIIKAFAVREANLQNVLKDVSFRNAKLAVCKQFLRFPIFYRHLSFSNGAVSPCYKIYF